MENEKIIFPLKRTHSPCQHWIQPQKSGWILHFSARSLVLGQTGDDRWYEKNIPVAERLYQKHLLILKTEEKNNE